MRTLPSSLSSPSTRPYHVSGLPNTRKFVSHSFLSVLAQLPADKTTVDDWLCCLNTVLAGREIILSQEQLKVLVKLQLDRSIAQCRLILARFSAEWWHEHIAIKDPDTLSVIAYRIAMPAQELRHFLYAIRIISIALCKKDRAQYETYVQEMLRFHRVNTDSIFVSRILNCIREIDRTFALSPYRPELEMTQLQEDAWKQYVTGSLESEFNTKKNSHEIDAIDSDVQSIFNAWHTTKLPPLPLQPWHSNEVSRLSALYTQAVEIEYPGRAAAANWKILHALSRRARQVVTQQLADDRCLLQPDNKRTNQAQENHVRASQEILRFIRTAPVKTETETETETETARRLTDQEMVDLINSQDDLGNTVLHYAVQNNNKPLVDILLAKGARLDIGNQAGKTPLDLPSADLIWNSVDPATRNTCLHWAVFYQQVGSFCTIYERAQHRLPRLSQANHAGLTPLQMPEIRALARAADDMQREAERKQRTVEARVKQTEQAFMQVLSHLESERERALCDQQLQVKLDSVHQAIQQARQGIGLTEIRTQLLQNPAIREHRDWLGYGLPKTYQDICNIHAYQEIYQIRHPAVSAPAPTVRTPATAESIMRAYRSAEQASSATAKILSRLNEIERAFSAIEQHLRARQEKYKHNLFYTDKLKMLQAVYLAYAKDDTRSLSAEALELLHKQSFTKKQTRCDFWNTRSKTFHLVQQVAEAVTDSPPRRASAPVA